MILTRDGKEIVAIYKQDGDEVDEVKDANGRLVYTNTREITGTLPLSFTSRGKPLTDYRISGNAVQDGTPTPEAPVDVVGCGVRTGNLFDGYIELGSLTASGADYESIIRCRTNYIGVMPDKAYTVSTPIDCIVRFILFYDKNKAVINYEKTSSEVYTFNTPYSAKTIRIVFGYKNDSSIIISEFPSDKIMLNEGSTALPYEPYGYKLPLTVNGTEYPIYLGDAQTTRRIKKLVLTGEETWYGTSKFRIGLSGQIGTIAPICTHYRGVTTAAYAGLEDGRVTVNGGGNLALAIYDTHNQTSVEDWKSYLSQQYQNGTPVTIWYVLAKQETGIINEPLMKISDYADTITMAQAGVTIPTINGANTLDMASTIKPSEVYIKGKGIRAIT